MARGGSYVLRYAKSPLIGMCMAIDLHMKYAGDRLCVKTSREIFNEAEQEWENNCGLAVSNVSAVLIFRYARRIATFSQFK